MVKIGAVTEDERLSPLIERLRKRSINVKKIKAEESLDGFNVLILDLAYPLEQAFTLLEKVTFNYQLAELTIFVAISKKSELLKLRTSGFKIDGYISSEISVEEFLEKIKEAKQPELLPMKKYKRALVESEVQGNITHISESGALISVPMAFRRKNEISLNSELFKQLGLNEKIICKILNSTPAPGKKFIAEVDFLNLTEEDRENLRKMTLSWRLK